MSQRESASRGRTYPLEASEIEEISIPYADGRLAARLPSSESLGVLEVADTPAVPDLDRAVREALRVPIGLDRDIFEIVRPGETVAIIVSDATRKTCVEEVLPVLVEGLIGAGVSEPAIRFVFSTGTHRGLTPEERERVLGKDIYRRFQGRIHDHDAHDPQGVVYVGTTRRGTPVEINRIVHESDRIIVTGAAVFHYFGGFGGGRKSVVPGVASAKTIAHNHAMNLDPEDDWLNPAVQIGAMDGNPVAEDMLEAARLTHVDYVINTVLNREGEIAGIFAGELEAAHRAATEMAQRLFSVDITRKADVVIAASPWTPNFVQTHKALYNAYQAVKPDGRIILAAPCVEGLGGEQFAKWIRLGSRSAIIAGLREQSEINGQTALSTVEKAPITLMVTEMSESDAAVLGARKATSLQEAVDLAFAEVDPAPGLAPSYYAMPSAAYTVPFQR